MENESIEGLYLNWDSASAGTHGMIPLEVDYNAEADNLALIFLILPIFALSAFFLFNKTRVEG